MARETKAQRQEREDAEALIHQQEFMEQYPKRLLNLVYEYGTLDWNNFRVFKEDDMFQFVAEHGSYTNKYMLPIETLEYSHDLEDSVCQAERRLRLYHEEIAEEIRIMNVKTEAKRKIQEILTEEERRLLGLS